MVPAAVVARNRGALGGPCGGPARRRADRGRGRVQPHGRRVATGWQYLAASARSDAFTGPSARARPSRSPWPVCRSGRIPCSGTPRPPMSWSPGDELAVPAQDRGRCDERAEATAHRPQSGEGGDQVAVGPIHPRAWRASSEHGGLATQTQDLDLLGHVRAAPQHHPAQELGEHVVDQLQRHWRIMLGSRRRRSSRSADVRRVSGTHTVAPRQLLLSGRPRATHRDARTPRMAGLSRPPVR